MNREIDGGAFKLDPLDYHKLRLMWRHLHWGGAVMLCNAETILKNTCY